MPRVLALLLLTACFKTPTTTHCGAVGEACCAGAACSSGSCDGTFCVASSPALAQASASCDPSTCNGCCDFAFDGGTRMACYPGTIETACGMGGNGCSTCPDTWSCTQQRCLPPASQCSDGCYTQGGLCIHSGDQNDAECGSGGGFCATCTNGSFCDTLAGQCSGGSPTPDMAMRPDLAMHGSTDMACARSMAAATAGGCVTSCSDSAYVCVLGDTTCHKKCTTDCDCPTGTTCQNATTPYCS